MNTSSSASTTLVRVTRVSPGTDPILFYNLCLGSDFKKYTKEIEMIHGEVHGGMDAPTSIMYCHMDSLNSAQRLVQELKGRKFGGSHLYMEMFPKIVPMTEAPGSSAAIKRLSDFLRETEAMPRTSTVCFTQLPQAHISKTIPHLVNESCCVSNGGSLLSAATLVQGIEEKHDEGKILVRFVDVDTAECMVDEYNGTWYKNQTIYAVCVDDKEFTGRIAGDRSGSAAKTVKLFVSMRPGSSASTEDIRKMFAPHVPKDVHIPAGKNFAFAFLHQEAAAKFMAMYPAGKKFGNQIYRVKYADQKQKGKAPSGCYPSVPLTKSSSAAPRLIDTYIVPSPVVKGPPAVRVNGLAYATTEENIRSLFVKAKFEVKDIVLHNSIANDIHAFVKLADHAEVERAKSTLKGRSLLKRKITLV